MQPSIPRHEQPLLARDAAVPTMRYTANPVDLTAEAPHDHDPPIVLPSLALYAVHALCTFDERLYEFASYFFLMEIFKTTLLPMSLYGFSTTVAGILFSTTVGSLVDSTPRLSAVQSFLFVQKAMTVFGCIAFWILLTWFDPSALSGPRPSTQTGQDLQDLQDLEPLPSIGIYQGYSLFAFLVLASGLLKLSALGWSISIERDWVVALCHFNTEKLTYLNVNMKRIDLGCKLVSPLVFAGILTQMSAGACSLVMAAWCVVSFMSELLLVRQIWFQSPVLWAPRSVHHGKDRQQQEDSEEDVTDMGGNETMARKRIPPFLRSQSDSHEEQHSDENRGLIQPPTQLHASVAHQGKVNVLKRVYQSFRAYSMHVVFLASMSYAIIYINMMSVSGTMIGYLQWRGFSAGSIALLKGICTAAELLGTIAMPILTRYLGLVRAGAWCIWFEVLTLTPVLFSIYSDRLPVQTFIFAGMALSRIGVWSF
ncbi:solute carrier family 40 (iron-regulated transporter), member 1 [Entomortierella parvispora]|uniref:Solute carrier family 40 member n=1 Tax=Entomortierella parvispora TaxID=205924 RepID=A0A9P3H6U3_9FUNG|nr:solute carrier family 40 (iron-regulated transporter), member 1 [Entomortierella parvispora]